MSDPIETILANTEIKLEAAEKRITELESACDQRLNFMYDKEKEIISLESKLKIATDALKLCADQANRETNGLMQYDSDGYGYILKKARNALSQLAKQDDDV